MNDEIPADIRSFLKKYVKTVGHLELLLFIYEGKDQIWTVSQLNHALRGNEALTIQQLRDLDGVVRSVGSEQRFQFAIIRLDMTETVRKMASLYRTKPHTLISAILAHKNVV